jgi:hypothetical protein
MAGMDDGAVRLMTFDPPSRTWVKKPRVLRHHRTAVLSLAAIHAGGGALVGVSGSTDGCIALFNAGEESPPRGEEDVVWVRGLHQSGVNGCEVCPAADIWGEGFDAGAGGEPWCVVTAGDDEAVSLITVIVKHRDAGGGLQVLDDRRWRREGVHGSTIRGLCLCGGVVFTVGADQRVVGQTPRTNEVLFRVTSEVKFQFDSIP